LNICSSALATTSGIGTARSERRDFGIVNVCSLLSQVRRTRMRACW